MDRYFYEDKISTMLQDTDFYDRISKTQENKTMSKIKRLVNEPLSECMTNKEKYTLQILKHEKVCFTAYLRYIN